MISFSVILVFFVIAQIIFALGVMVGGSEWWARNRHKSIEEIIDEWSKR